MKDKVFLDTNILVRYLTTTDKEIHQSISGLITKFALGELRPYISETVILETSFVLDRIYKVKKESVIKALKTFLTLRNLTIIKESDLTKALKYFENLNVKFPDSLIATQIPKGCTLCTFDKDFSKFKGLKVKTPAQLL